MPLVEAHRVVVILVEQGALVSAHQGVVLLALPLGQGTDERALVVVVAGLLAQPCRHLRARAIDRDRPIGGTALALLLLPLAGADRLEGLDDVAQAPLHGLEHFEHTMEMVGHAHAGVHCHAVAARRLFLGSGFPRLFHHFAQR